TATDMDGRWELMNVATDAVLVLSYVGYVTEEITDNGQTDLQIVLEGDSQTLDQEVVVGYGTQKKANMTGSSEIATTERLENRTITSLGQGLQGVIPGLNITYSYGDPNESANFNIRGFESINGGSPLILVDGIPMDVERINPNDIKSIS